MDRRDRLAGGEIEDVGAAAEGIHLGLRTYVCPLQAPPALEIEDFGAVLDEYDRLEGIAGDVVPHPDPVPPPSG